MLATTGLGIGLLGSAFLLGLRHGIDWDHIAAITDLSATEPSSRRSLTRGMLYIVGHGLVVLAIGLLVVAAGRSLPEWVDAFFGYLVGWTLILLGAYVLWSVVKHRDGFRMQSRWMLLIRGGRRLSSRLRRHREFEHEHPHGAFEDVHHDTVDRHDSRGWVHSHPHVHGAGDELSDRAAFGVGMLHGVGVETPTQVVTFLAASQAGGTMAGVVVLLTFLVGLFISNTGIVLASTFGFRQAARRRRAYLALGAVTGVASLIVGVLFVLGQDAVLPAFFAG